jgi:hypothetical protein
MKVPIRHSSLMGLVFSQSHSAAIRAFAIMPSNLLPAASYASEPGLKRIEKLFS